VEGNAETLGESTSISSHMDLLEYPFNAFGAELKAFYLVNGQYDAVVVAEAPDDETATKVALAISTLGNVRTETLRAYTESEYREIIAALP